VAAAGTVTFLTVALAYNTLFIGGGEGATPGMRLFGIEARGLNGGRPDYFSRRSSIDSLFYATGDRDASSCVRASCS